MSDASLSMAARPLALPQRPQLLVLAGLFLALAATKAGDGDWRGLALVAIGGGLGLSLFHAAFGFTAAYRNFILERDISGLAAQAVMLALAMLLFAPVLAAGGAFGQPAGGFVAPLDAGLFFGAFVFGIAMQIAGGCASGTLFTAGGGNARMVVVLVFFCAGSWWATLDLPFWQSLPALLPPVSLGERLGYPAAVALQLAALGGILWLLRRAGGRFVRPLWGEGFGWRRLATGPWPIVLGAVMLALLNFATLLTKGAPWGITWGFALWGAKAAAAFGWDPAGSPFWGADWRNGPLGASVLAEPTSLMNLAIILGAGMAAALAGKIRPVLAMGWRPLAAAVLGGLMLGYGARLAYGCNIGAFFSGVASTSLHGWVWILLAMAGNVVGVRLRPFFRLP